MFLHVVQLNAPRALSSWEYFTTLDYEWRVIRHRLPYRWTIWVRNDRHFTLTQSARAVPRPCADARSVDLLLLAFDRSSEHYPSLCHFGRYCPIKLSSRYFDLCLPLSGADQPQLRSSGTFLRSWAHFNTFPRLRERGFSSCCHFHRCSYAYLRFPLPC